MSKKFKIVSVVVVAVCLVGFGVWGAYGLIQDNKKLENKSEEKKVDWKAEADKMFNELQAENNADKIDWQAEADKMLGELYDKNKEGEIDWISESDKMLSELIEENKTDKIDWQAEADRMFDELQDENNDTKIDWQAETERLLAELDGLKENLDDTGLESDAVNLDSELGSSSYVGTWRKTASYVNGKIEDHAVSTLTLGRDSYEAKTSCIVLGKLSISNNKMSVVITSDGCTGGIAPQSYAYDYQVSHDGKILTLSYSQAGFIMKETFEKIK